MSKSAISIEVRVYDHGKQGILDAGDKLAITFRDEYGRFVHATKPMSLDEFKKNSLQEFKKAFPSLSLFKTPFLPILGGLTSSRKKEVCFLSDLDFSTHLVLSLLTGSGFDDELMAKPSAFDSLGQNLSPLGIGIYFGVDSKAPRIDGMNPFAFFGVEEQNSLQAYSIRLGGEQWIEMKTYPWGPLSVKLITPYDGGAIPSTDRHYERQNYWVDRKNNRWDAPIFR